MLLAVGLASIVLDVALQGRGHRLEVVPPEPFTGSFKFLSRLFFERWFTFPRFVISGAGARPCARCAIRKHPARPDRAPAAKA